MPFGLLLLIALAYSTLWARVIPKLPNWPIIRCGTCGATLYAHPRTGRWIFIDHMIWMLVAWVVVLRHHLPTIALISFGITLTIVWPIVVRRTVHAYFRWRHPLRCQGGGHLKPAPEGA